MISQKGTEDCKTVQQYEIGNCLDLSNIDKAVNDILNISREQLHKWQQNFNQLPTNVYLHTDEHEKLIYLLQK